MTHPIDSLTGKIQASCQRINGHGATQYIKLRDVERIIREHSAAPEVVERAEMAIRKILSLAEAGFGTKDIYTDMTKAAIAAYAGSTTQLQESEPSDSESSIPRPIGSLEVTSAASCAKYVQVPLYIGHDRAYSVQYNKPHGGGFYRSIEDFMGDAARGDTAASCANSLNDWRDAMKSAGGWTDKAISDNPDIVRDHLIITAQKTLVALKTSEIPVIDPRPIIRKLVEDCEGADERSEEIADAIRPYLRTTEPVSVNPANSEALRVIRVMGKALERADGIIRNKGHFCGDWMTEALTEADKFLKEQGDE